MKQKYWQRLERHDSRIYYSALEILSPTKEYHKHKRITMTKLTISTLLLVSFFSSTLLAADWYRVGLDVWLNTEVSGDTINLQKPDPNWNVTSNVNSKSGGSCQTKWVVITPPSQKTSVWLSMILTGQATGRNLWVYGDCTENVVKTTSTGRIMLE